jgi:hypothetical protein
MDTARLVETDLKGYKKMNMFSHCSVNFEKGRIINSNTKEILGKVDDESGYEVLTANDKLKLLKHRLIWMEAHPTEVIKEDEMIIHIDGNKTNNKISNLKKVSKYEDTKESKIDSTPPERFVHIKEYEKLSDKYDSLVFDITYFIEEIMTSKADLDKKYDFIKEINLKDEEKD